ncbi:hypothetical protein [Agrobacterium sp. NPDC089420]|uniref:hypothetical protein n=1 Tax=Agrobacterium sp. NPDC089420 TaxID=3363918 RepID=UPI0038511462
MPSIVTRSDCSEGLFRDDETKAIHWTPCITENDGRVHYRRKGQCNFGGACLTRPFDLANYIRKRSEHVEKVGIDAGALSPWLNTELTKAGLPVVMIATFQTYRALSMRRSKTGKSDAHGLMSTADLLLP